MAGDQRADISIDQHSSPEKQENNELLLTLNGVMSKLAAAKQENTTLNELVSTEARELQEAKDYVEQLQQNFQDAKNEVQRLKEYIQTSVNETVEYKVMKPAYDGIVKEVDAQRAENKMLKQKVEDLQLAYRSVAEGSNSQNASMEAILKQHVNVEAELDQLKLEYSQAKSDLHYIKNERDMLLESAQLLQPRLIELEDYKADGMNAIEEAQRIVRDQQTFGDQQDASSDSHRVKELQAEVDRLQNRLDGLKSGLDLSLRTEIARLKSVQQSECSVLFEHNAQLEAENARLQSQLESIQRDVRQFQAELTDKAHLESSQQEQRAMEINELHQRLNRMVSERDNAVYLLDCQLVKFRKYQSQYDNDSKFASERNDLLHQRVKALELEAQDSQQELLNFFKVCQDQESLIQQLSESSQQMVNDHDLVLQRTRMEIADINELWQTKFNVLEASKVKLDQELNTMVEQQSKTALKWKDEISDLSRKHELAQEKLRQEFEKLQASYDQLKQTNIQIMTLKDELNTQHVDDSKNLDQMTHLVTLSNDKCQSLSLQVQELIGRQSQLVNEKKALQRQVDQLNLLKRRHENASKRPLFYSLNNKLTGNEENVVKLKDEVLQSLPDYLLEGEQQLTTEAL